jgi:glycerol-3-phosphate dehydrogenase
VLEEGFRYVAQFPVGVLRDLDENVERLVRIAPTLTNENAFRLLNHGA